MPSSRFLAVLLAVASVSATVLDSSFLAHRSLADHLVARQTSALDPSTFPQQCQRTCTPIINTLNTCNTRTPGQQLSCLCTSNNGQALKTCLDCLVDVLPSQSQVTQAQGVLDTFNTNCREFNLPPYTVHNPVSEPSKPPVSFSSQPSPSQPTVPQSSPPSIPSASNPIVPSPQPSNPAPANPIPSPQPSNPVLPSPSSSANEGGGSGNNNNGNNSNNDNDNPFAKNGGFVNQASVGVALSVVALAMVL